MIPFNKPYMTGKELYYIAKSHFNNQLAGDGPFTLKCHQWLEHNSGANKALLTHSCTAALEMSALLLNIQPGDEVIMPSYTFVSTANAFVMRGAVPVFVDIREDTQNINETLIESAITNKSRAIVPVHYAGVACEMDTIGQLAKKYDLVVVEDAAQGIMSTYKGEKLGTLGDLGTYSFHETKNVICGEGGALLVNNPKFVYHAEVIREKGTDRSRFFRGEVDKYTWQEPGSSFLPGELNAAFLWAQLEEAHSILTSRINIWDNYFERLTFLQQQGLVKLPQIPDDCEHNAHMFYIILAKQFDRKMVLDQLKAKGVGAVFHYVPLHSSPAGKRLGRVASDMKVTDHHSSQLIRLPLWIGMDTVTQDFIVNSLTEVLLGT